VNELPTEPLVLDGRNLYEPQLMRSLGIDCVGSGRGVRAVPTWKG